MPTEPLIDPAAFEHTATRFDRAHVMERCKQRGRFQLLDGILSFDESSGISVGFKDLREDDWWTTDHIPGRPLFPGALMCEAAAQLSTWDFLMRRASQEDIFLGFGGMNETRFRSVVTPGRRLLLACRATRIRSKMYTYDAQGFADGKLAFETEILGLVL